MERVIEKLEGLKLQHPTNNNIDELLARLQRRPPPSWSALQDEFGSLERDGIWISSAENNVALEGLKMELDSSTNTSSPDGRRDIHIVQPPPQMSPHPLLHSLSKDTRLPLELLDSLNQTYFLHLLVNDPEKVLPPGKSLLSVLSKPHARESRDTELPTLQEKVEEVIHKAFWDEALEAVSSTEPSVQLPRLKLLYHDLYIALKPLLPSNHIVLITLSSPLSPTSSPLLSAITHIREILLALRQRCAPIRDHDLDVLLGRLDVSSSTVTSSTPQLVIDTIRSILKLAELMKDDLSQFVLGTMGEGQLKAAILEQAIEREREMVSEVWKSEEIEKEWRAWMKGSSQDAVVDAEGQAVRKQYLKRLMQALCGPTPVFCSLPTIPTSPSTDEQQQETPNGPTHLPPIFFFSITDLVFIQNFLQTIVITACLRILLPPQATDPSGTASTFTSRVITLLLASIDALSDDSTKLINLADELVRAAGPLGPEEEKRLRDAVDRTLRLQDPVFALLQQRLTRAIVDRLLHRPQTRLGTKRGIEMRTGRDLKGKRMRVETGSAVESSRKEDDSWDGVGEVVKGFEDLELSKRVNEVTGRLGKVLLWVDDVWGEVAGQLGLNGLDRRAHDH